MHLLLRKASEGNHFIDNFARDIKNTFPDSKGFSVRNLKYMKKFSLIFSEDAIDKFGFDGITWYHHMALMDNTDSEEKYIWYAQKAVENGWTRDLLAIQIVFCSNKCVEIFIAAYRACIECFFRSAFVMVLFQYTVINIRIFHE